MRAEVPRRRVQYVRDHEPGAGRARLVALHRHRHSAGGPRARCPYRIQRPTPPPRAQHLAPPQGEALNCSSVTENTSHADVRAQSVFLLTDQRFEFGYVAWSPTHSTLKSYRARRVCLLTNLEFEQLGHCKTGQMNTALFCPLHLLSCSFALVTECTSLVADGTVPETNITESVEST